jgi:hypothetical protein
MTQLKILVHNINDVANRAAFEKELNVYLKLGWALKDTHQAVSPGTGFLMMTAVLEREAEETDKEQDEVAKKGTLTDLAEESRKKEAGNDGKQDDVKETSTEDATQGAGKEKAGPEKEAVQNATMPKGFKMKDTGNEEALKGAADASTSPAEDTKTETSQETGATKEPEKDDEEKNE